MNANKSQLFNRDDGFEINNEWDRLTPHLSKKLLIGEDRKNDGRRNVVST